MEMRRAEIVKPHTIRLYAALCKVMGEDGKYNPADLLVDSFVEICKKYWEEHDFDPIDESMKKDQYLWEFYGRKKELVGIIYGILSEGENGLGCHNLIENVDRAIHAQVILNRNVEVPKK